MSAEPRPNSEVRQYPFPVPFGWFRVAYPEELQGDPIARYYFGKHLVLWRSEAGEVHVQDAFCPHLGAHLGHGGKVKGECIECPFHGWLFDGEGTNTDIPYSERVNRKARLRVYPAVERNGFVMAWYHPDPDQAPMWDLPEVEAFSGDHPDYSEVIATRHVVDAALQELAENGVDAAHFRYVHNTAEVPVLESYETGFPENDMKSAQKFVTPQGVMEGRIDSHMWGPGFSVVHFSGIVDTVNVATSTPIDAGRSELAFHFRFKSMGDADTTRSVGKAFVREVDKQVQEDIPIWEHKAHLVRPALADNDGPFTKFRKWYHQFYDGGVDFGDELVIEPPYWPDRLDESPAKATASARHGTS